MSSSLCIRLLYLGADPTCETALPALPNAARPCWAALGHEHPNACNNPTRTLSPMLLLPMPQEHCTPEMVERLTAIIRAQQAQVSTHLSRFRI